MKQIKVILFLFCFSFLVKGQTIQFQRTYGFSNHDFLKSKQTPDGGYILYGEKNYNATNSEILIIKTDSAGTIAWSKTYSTTDDYDDVWELEIFNNSYVICGSSSISNPGFLLKIDLLGNVVWMKTNIFATHLARTGSGFVVTTPTVNNSYITKLDSNFHVVWRKKYNIQGQTSTSCIKKTFDGGFIIGGNMFGFNNSLDFNLIKTDSLGNILWVKMYGGIYDEWFPEVEPTFDGGLIMLGSTQSYGVGNDDAFLVKLDASGNVQWARTYGGVLGDDGYMVKPTFGSIGYIITGTTQGFSNDVDDSACTCSQRSFLIKTDINGNFQWARRYGIGPMDNASTVWQTQDAGYIFSGQTAAWGAGAYEGWLIKTDNMGVSGCYDWATVPFVTSPTILDSSLTWTESNDTLTLGTGTLFDSVVTPYTTIECTNIPSGILEHHNESSFSIYPNPANETITIDLQNLKDAERFEIYNSIGQFIFSSAITSQQTSINLNNFSSGIYLLRVLNRENKTHTIKFVKE